MTGDDHVLARDLAGQAGQRLLELRAQGGDPDVLRKAGDRLSHEFLTAALAARRPGDVVLSEEGADNPARLGARRVWIVDPLDGTREFGEPGRVDWAVHVALVEQETPTAAAVALPALAKVLSTGSPPTLAPPPSPAPLPSTGASAGPRIVVSRTRPPALSAFLAERLGGELVPMGSAGAKTMAIVLGDADVYAHGGGQYEWDSAAPVGVAASAGLHVSRLDGSPLRYNQPDPYLPDLLVCRPELAAAVLDAVGS